MNELLQLCRICLKKRANIPIFQECEESSKISSKLFLCLREKIEDIDGFPKNICSKCNKELDAACAFITKYQDSCSILANEIKQEKLENNDEKQEINVFKCEFSDNSNHYEEQIEYNDLCKPKETTKDCLNEQSKVKIKKEKKNPVSLQLKEWKTNKLASSILERSFTWDGEIWHPDGRKLPSGKEKVSAVSRKPLKKIKKAKKSKDITQKNQEKLCSLCGKVVKNSDRLSHHMKVKHFPENLQCPMCPKKYGTKHYLKRHIQFKHTTEKNFVCATCGKGFVIKSLLNRHMLKSHNSDFVKKVYSCSYCSKSYSCQKSVTIHERSVHTGLRPAVCTICESAFFHEEYLKEHMRLHTGETPFKCPVCNRGYAQRGNMKSHIRIHRISELDSNTLSKLKPNLLKLMKD